MLTYKQLGSDADKDAVHRATKKLDKGLYPGAFCYISEDIAGDPDYCFLKHTDGSGSKANIAYMANQEGADIEIWRGIAHDSLTMNIDDMACVGATDYFQVTNCIDRNPFLISDEAVAEIINGYHKSAQDLSSYTRIKMCGGETADTGNNVRTIVVNSDVCARVARSKVIDASNTAVGDVLVGFASYGKATYEEKYNSGVSSNGFTLLTHALLSSYYKEKYPETFSPNIKEQAYSGKFTFDTEIPNCPLTLGEALLSPTRTYLPLIKAILENYHQDIKGIFNCTGGAITKPIRFGKNIKYLINNPIAPGPFFEFVYHNTNVAPQELYKTFNMGCRLIVACSPMVSDILIEIGSSFGIYAQVIGEVVPSSREGVNEVEIVDPVGGEVLRYEK